MLTIRMQRTGRKGHAMFRMVVQDARRTPTSGSVVAYLGSYDPHAKTVILDKEKAAYFLEHGAQPTPRVVGILKSEKVKLPSWVKEPDPKKRDVRNPEKRRSTSPEVKTEEVTPAAPTEQVSEPETIDETVVEEPTAEETVAEEAVVEETLKVSEDTTPETKPA